MTKKPPGRRRGQKHLLSIDLHERIMAIIREAGIRRRLPNSGVACPDCGGELIWDEATTVFTPYATAEFACPCGRRARLAIGG